jgi:putative redox protein
LSKEPLEVIKTKSTYKWTKNFTAVVDNGRNHAMVMDLPPDKEGDDLGPTALEVCVMSLSGCIGTIYALIAKKMRLTVEDIVVELEADKGPDDPTITAVRAEVKVKSPEKEEKLQKCLETTLNSCPVGVLFTEAGIELDVKVVVEN